MPIGYPYCFGICCRHLSSVLFASRGSDNLEPVRIVALVNVLNVEGVEENWQRPIEKEEIDKLLG